MSIGNVCIRATVVMMGAVLMACCSSQKSATPSPTHGASSAVGINAAAGELLTVEPANPQACDSKGPVVAVVRWKSTHPQVRVMETNPGEPTRLFSGGGYAGQATTGAWVVAATRFTLVDAATGTTLATAMLNSTRCKR